MIEEIVIRDLGVIREAKLQFGPGLTVLTGETGAGKTMVLNAVGLLLGERSDSSAIRKGQPQAYVEGRWLLSKETAASLRESDVEFEDDELILSRSVSSEGRSRATISGRSVPVGMLAELGDRLVVVHGQAEQARLRSNQAQREALDLFAGNKFSEVLLEYRDVYSSWRSVADRVSRLSSQSEARALEAEELKRSIEELEKLDPKEGEDVALAELAERLTHLEALRQAASSAHQELSPEGFDDATGALTSVGRARKALEQVADYDPKLAELAEQLRELGFTLNDAAANLAGYLAGLESESGSELEQTQQRRAAISAAIKKYGGDLQSVIDFRESAGQRLLDLDSSDEAIDKLRAEEQALANQAKELSAELTKIRLAAAKDLAKSVTAELAALAMTGATLVVEVEPLSQLGPFGADQVSIQLSAYPGADPRPLGKGASGGELSRIMLAIEVVLAQKEMAPTFVFDEVDAGVGGASATEVGRRLAKLARSAQVIVVTHLPQVAAFANQHLKVMKNSAGEFTASDIAKLEGEAIVEELVRMLSGLSDSESGRTHAQELLERAKSEKI